MYIKSLKLINFQKHSDLTLNFINGVNIIAGKSEAGKSCVRRSIEWLTMNIKFDKVRKYGTKKTSVQITLDNGIVIERIRTASINRYILRKDEDEQVFDSIGKKIPDAIRDVLKMNPIEIDGEEIYLNSAPQIALPFLFDRSGTFRQKLFNKLTGNDILDKLFVGFNKDLLHIGKELKNETENFELQIKIIEEKEVEKEKIEAIYTKIKKTITNVKENYKKYNKLDQLKDTLKNIEESQEGLDKELKEIKIPSILPLEELSSKTDRLEQLKQAQTALEATNIALTKTNAQLKAIRLPELNFDILGDKIERLGVLKIHIEDLDKTQEMCYTLSNKIKINDKTLIDAKNKYIELLKLSKICYICGSKITDECIKGMKL